jgi:hypothetical protein
MAKYPKIDKAQIDAAFERRDFDSLFSLFTNVHYSSSELLIFYRRKNGSSVLSKLKLFNLKEFWTSQLPHFHLKSILESDRKVEFLSCYFSKNEFCNPELDKHLVMLAKDEYVKHFKLWKAFDHPNFLLSFKHLGHSDTEIGRTASEVEIVIKSQERIKSEAAEDDQVFLRHNLGEVLLAFTLYCQEFKRDELVAGNRSWQTKVEMALVDNLNHIFSIFKDQPCLAFGFSSNENLQKQFQINGRPSFQSSSHFQVIFDLIERLIDRRICETRIELYLCGYSDFLSILLNPTVLKTNNNYRVFNINNAKVHAEGLYFIQHLEVPSPTDITPENESLKFYGFPEIVNSEDGQIEIKKALQLLKQFAILKGPPQLGDLLTDRKLFAELFGPNEHISLFEFNGLLEDIAKYFSWTVDEAKTTLSFLTFDLTAPSFPYNWLFKPFLKINNQILWLGAFLKDRRWDNILMNKLKPFVKKRPQNFELRIEQLFKSSLFETVSGVPFNSSNGPKGDFDVLAYKDNCLFVCEAKSGLRSDGFSHAAWSETVKLEGLAVGQLEKAGFNIEEDWVNIKAKLGIDGDVSFDSVKIVPLIVTDFFEGDLHVYKNGVRKISLLELDVIFKNRKKELLEFYVTRYPSIAESQNPDINENAGVISNWDLWDGKESLMVETILRNIEQNSIWKELESVWKFEDEEYPLEY